MALNPSGAISLGGPSVGQSIALELGLSATAQISSNDTVVRTLGGVASGQISMNTFWGKSNVLPRYVLSDTPSSMAISPDKTQVAYFRTSGTAMNVWVFNTSNFSLAYAKTSTVINSNITIYGTVGAFDSSNNLLVAQSSYTSPAEGGWANNNISFVLYNSTGTLVASRYSGPGETNGVNGLSNAFFANGFFYVSGRINNKGQIIKRSSTNLVFSADLLRSINPIIASGNASENNAYSLDDVYQSFNNVVVTNLSTASNTYKKHVPASQYSASYGATSAVRLSNRSVMASNYLIEERMEGTWSVTGPTFRPTISFTNPKPYTFITNISSTNTATSCYAIFHDSLAALKLASQRADEWPRDSGGMPSWNNNTVISDLRDNLIVIVGDTYFFNQLATPKLSYTGAHLTIFNTLTNVVIASAVCTSPTYFPYGASFPTGAAQLLGINGASVGDYRKDSPTLAITNEYLYIGKNIIPRPQSSSSLATTLNSIGAGLTWSAATTTVSSVAVTTTTPALSTHVLTMADTAYTPTITTYTPTPSFTSI